MAPAAAVAAPVNTRKALAVLKAAFANRQTTACKVAGIGSSTMAGSNATLEQYRFFNRLARAIQSAYPSGLGTETPIVASTTATFTNTTAAGTHFFNAGVGGTTAANYLPSGPRALVAALAPRVIIHVIGSNDYSTGVAKATYKANVKAVIDALDAAITADHVHILVHAHQRTDVASPAVPWSDYGAALQELAEADANRRIFVDLASMWSLLGIPGADPWDFLDTDNVHLRNTGHMLMAEYLRQELHIPGSIPTPLVPLSDTFTRTVAGGLGTADSGQVWSADASWSVDGAKATGNGHALIEAASSNFDYSVQVTHGSVAGALGMSFAALDANNRLAWYIDSGFPALAKVDAGTLTNLYSGGTAVTTTAGTVHTLRVVKTGTTVTAYLDGVQQTQYTLTAAEQTKYNAYTKVGLRQSAVSVGTFDNVNSTPA